MCMLLENFTIFIGENSKMSSLLEQNGQTMTFL